jgi:hypothetical protein
LPAAFLRGEDEKHRGLTDRGDYSDQHNAKVTPSEATTATV